MEQKIEILLDRCIDELRRGKSLEETLAGYPEYASQLLPLLELVQEMKTVPLPAPSPGAFAATMVQVGQELERRNTPLRSRSSAGSILSRASLGNFFRRPAFAWTFSGALAMILFLFGAATISASSLPGDILYPIKLATEKVRFLLTLNSEKKAELRLTFSDRRLEEMMQTFQQSSVLDTTLLKSMLDEAKLALEETEPSPQTSSLFLTKLSHTNALQKDVLTRIRPHLSPAVRPDVDEAISMCDMRDRWMKRMMDEEYDSAPRESDTSHSKQLPPQKKQKRGRWRWGPGCDWME